MAHSRNRILMDYLRRGDSYFDRINTIRARYPQPFQGWQTVSVNWHALRPIIEWPTLGTREFWRWAEKCAIHTDISKAKQFVRLGMLYKSYLIKNHDKIDNLLEGREGVQLHLRRFVRSLYREQHGEDEWDVLRLELSRCIENEESSSPRLIQYGEKNALRPTLAARIPERIDKAPDGWIRITYAAKEVCRSFEYLKDKPKLRRVITDIRRYAEANPAESWGTYDERRIAPSIVGHFIKKYENALCEKADEEESGPLRQPVITRRSKK